MKKHIQSRFWVLSIWLMLSGWAVNAAPPPAETSDVEYQRYPWDHYPLGRKYHRFFPTPAPGELFYHTRMKAIANIDDTPEKETVVLISADTGVNKQWAQAFLLILDETEMDVPKKKDFFALRDTNQYDFEVSTKSIEFHDPPLTFRKPPKNAHGYRSPSFELIDLTGDGTLDLWVEFGHAVAVISFQKGEFRVVFSSYARYGTQAKAYVDLDNDGIYEIKTPHGMYLNTKSKSLLWINLYEWNGIAYVLNNAKFYADNDELLKQLLKLYNDHVLYQKSRLKQGSTPIPERKREEFTTYIEKFEFYIGLTFYYRGEAERAKVYLQRVAEQGKNENYIQVAESILKKLPHH